jgi:DNA mismatch repair protein MutS
MSIVSAGIFELCKRKTSFIFASHLHDLVNIQQIKDQKNLAIMHLEVRYDEASKKLVYDRILKDGPGNTLYGLEVCRALDLDPQFLITANEIRHNILGTEASIISYRRTRYNASKHIDNCAICGCKSTDVHHINEQYMSDNKGFIDYFHKNSLFNLVCICESCHHRVHNNDINITGYIQTSSGIELKYDLVHKDTSKQNELTEDVIVKIKDMRKTGTSISKIVEHIKKEYAIELSSYRATKILRSK